jgi:hypothetical protein
MPALNSDGRDIAVGDVIVRSPGLEGEAELTPSAERGQRGPAGVTMPALEAALAGTELTAFRTITIRNTRAVGPTRRRGQRGAAAPRQLEVEVPDPGPDYGQVLLHQNEAGVVTWHLPEPPAQPRGRGKRQARGAGDRLHYRIPADVPPAPGGAGQTRGLLGLIGSKVLSALVFPLLDPVLGRVGDFFAQRWEAKNRPYRLRTFAVETYGSPPVGTWADADWTTMRGGRALLFVHGTGSRTHTGFGALPREFVSGLQQLYDGRVFAIDHPTLSSTPTENVEWLIHQMPDGLELDLDIVCHSRGGLVSRVLTERQSTLELGRRRVSIGKLVMIGVPNAGTALADTKHLSSFIDSYTTILNLIPSPAAVDVLESVITILKQLAVGAFKGLDGVQSMLPDGPFLKQLNVEAPALGGSRYHAMASNFEPSQPGFAQFKDAIIDKIFEIDNDGIVPTDGVFAQNGSSLFPLESGNCHVFQGSVDHSGYFANATARDIIRGWLAA